MMSEPDSWEAGRPSEWEVRTTVSLTERTMGSEDREEAETASWGPLRSIREATKALVELAAERSDRRSGRTPEAPEWATGIGAASAEGDAHLGGARGGTV